MNASYRGIISHYEDCLKQHGEGARAVDWKSEQDAAIRYDVMLGLIRPDPARVSLLDFGCGLGGLYNHIGARGGHPIDYSGLDASKDFAEATQRLLPGVPVYCQDILVDSSGLPQFDYVVMNGIFTRRHEMSYADMMDYLQRLLSKAYEHARIGIAFNVMSQFVDWELETLFHASVADVSAFIGSRLSRNFTIRNDYGLFETTYYIYREPTFARK
ncbi:SAM-dependent methyltransferase [Bosea sp. OAE506]|uniref:class I SAM-dependent methyltransferase n=1 Tax=Bosea sp. OAE506 TaxID=2663870 RepID=UPI00178B0274